MLIVEDIIDSGLTLSWLQANAWTRCHLRQDRDRLRKPGGRKIDVDVAYVGFDIPDEFVVGCNLDYAESTVICLSSARCSRRSTTTRRPRGDP